MIGKKKNLPAPREKASACSHSKIKMQSGPHSFEGPKGPIVTYKWVCDTTNGCKYWFWGDKKGNSI